MQISRRTALWLAGIVVAGSAVRLWGLADESLWLDEAASLLHARRPFAELFSTVVDPGNPPLYYALLKAWILPCGTSEAALRALSVLCGIAAIPLGFALAVELFADERVGLAAAALLAVLPGHVYYSQEARQYALLFLLGLAAVWAWARAVRTDRRGPYLLFAALGALGFGVHYTGALVPALAGIHALVFVRRRRAFAALAACAALCLPGVLLYLGPSLSQGPGDGGWQARFSAGATVGFANALFGWPLLADAPLAANLPFFASLAVAALLPVALPLPGLRARSPDERRSLGLALCYLLIPFGFLAIAASLRPMWHPRYLLLAAPGLVLLAAWALVRSTRRWRLVLGSVLVFLCLFGLTAARTRWLKADWREAAAAVQAVERASGGTGRVLVTMPFQDWPLAYYHHGAWLRTGYQQGAPVDCGKLLALADAPGTTVLLQADAADGDPGLVVARQLSRRHGGGFFRSLVGIRLFAFGPGAEASGGQRVSEADLSLPDSPCP